LTQLWFECDPLWSA